MIILEIIFVLFICTLSRSQTTSSSSDESNKTFTKEISYANCCDFVNKSCLQEDFPLSLPKKWIAVNKDIRERYTHGAREDWCSSNTSIEVTVNVTDLLTKEKLYDGGGNESQASLEEESNLPNSIFDNYQFDGFYYSSRDYCILKGGEESLTLKLCKSRCESENVVCIPKCCPLGQSLNVRSMECVSGAETWEPKIYLDDTTRLSQDESKSLKLQYLHFNKSCDPILCSDYKNIESITSNNISRHGRLRFLKNGDLRVRLTSWITLSQSKSNFCLDSIHDLPNATVALMCLGMESSEDPNPHLRILSAAINIIEAFFTLFTTFIYLLLWKTLVGNIHRLTQFFHVTSYGLLLLAKFFVLSMHSLYRGQTSCIIIGIVTHYLVLTTGGWMVLINWDLFITFWKMQTGGSKKIKRIFYYCLFGWVAPLLPIIVGFVLTSIYGSDDDTNVILPEYGKYLCFTSTNSAYYYAYIPVVAEYVIVIILFVTTVIIIYNHKRSTTFATKTARQNRKPSTAEDLTNNNRFSLSPMQKENFKLFAKLTALSGLLGFLDVLSLLPDEYSEKWIVLFKLHALILDHLLGFILFWLYICNKTTLKALQKLYPRLFTHCPVWLKSSRRDSMELATTVVETRCQRDSISSD